jgi:hypothetical protein
MNKSKLYFSASLAIVTLVTEIYALVSLNQGLFRLATGMGQTLIFFSIAWLLYGIGEKSKPVEIESGNKQAIISGLIVWVLTSSVFRLLGPNYLTIIIVFLLLAAISYLAGRRGNLGFTFNKVSQANK